MEIRIEDLKDIELMKKAFDCLRLIDTEYKSIVQEYFISSSTKPITGFNDKERWKDYEECLELNSATYKIKQHKHFLFFFVVLPINRKYILECIANITESIELNPFCKMIESVYKLTITDELTGVYNRRHINHALPNAINSCAKNKMPLSVIFTDLDSFKDINDLYGHVAGDYLLSQFAIDLECNLRQGIDWVARYGGDEFLLCLVDTNNDKAKIIAEQIRSDIEQKITIYRGHKIKTTCSLGVYTLDRFDTIPTYDFVLKEVDKRLYAAKNAGKNQVK